jgi:hypothetical protein
VWNSWTKENVVSQQSHFHTVYSLDSGDAAETNLESPGDQHRQGRCDPAGRPRFVVQGSTVVRGPFDRQVLRTALAGDEVPDGPSIRREPV